MGHRGDNTMHARTNEVYLLLNSPHNIKCNNHILVVMREKNAMCNYKCVKFTSESSPRQVPTFILKVIVCNDILLSIIIMLRIPGTYRGLLDDLKSTMVIQSMVINITVIVL